MFNLNSEVEGDTGIVGQASSLSPRASCPRGFGWCRGNFSPGIRGLEARPTTPFRISG